MPQALSFGAPLVSTPPFGRVIARHRQEKFGQHVLHKDFAAYLEGDVAALFHVENGIAELKRLEHLTGLDEIKGIGVRITLSDNSSVNRVDFSSLNEYFVQATDLRDLVNALFLKDATAVAINGKRILPLTTIQAVFDSILVGNIQISSPFVVEAVGTPAGLQDALQQIQERKIQIFVDPNVNLTIPPLEMANVRAAQYMSLTDTSQ